ncbi:hypothetical protein PG984_001324 [Apiospora sp. TS-2023a]
MATMNNLAPSSSAPYPVYVGFWTNWSQGSMFGATLTLTQSNANLLIAFVAFLVTVSTANLWGIICFAAHHLYSTNNPRDTIHHQRQAILRNNAGPFGSFNMLVQLAWAWRKSKKRSLRRLVPLLVCIVVLMSGFTTASIFAARIATGTEALISSPSCGVIGNDNRDRSAIDNMQLLVPYMTRGVSLAANYAQQCYSSNGPPSPLDCGTYVKKRMPFTVTTNATCPFDPSICTRTDGSLLLDTGYMDSHEDFGINAPSQERWQFRKTVHCSPLVTNGFTTRHNKTPERLYRRYTYGSNLQMDTNWTYEYPDEYDVQKQFNIEGINHEYTLSARRYAAEFRNPWNGQGATPIYASDEPASPLACAQQQQICNSNHPGGRICTPMSGVSDMNRLSVELFDATGNQRLVWSATAGWSIEGGPIQTAVQVLKLDALESRRAMAGSYQGPLPDNQWQRDVKYWFEVSLSAWQKGFVDSAVGVSNPDVLSWVSAPNNTEEHKLCNSQKIRSTTHASFSVFGLFFIVSACILLTTVNVTLESMTKCIQQRCRLNPYARLEWTSNHTLQLQRLAHEELGMGEWTDCDKTIPIMLRPDVGLVPLDLGEEHHPRLVRGRLQGKEAAAIGGAMASSMESMLATEETSGSLQRTGSVPMLPQITVIPGLLDDSASEVEIERGEDSVPRRG